MKPGKPLSRKTPLKAGGPLNRTTRLKSTGKLAPVSKKMRVRQKSKNEAYDHVREQEWCPCCGQPGECTPSHVFPTGMYQEHEAKPANILPLCWSCHMLWQNHIGTFKTKYPKTWALKIAAMQEVSPKDFLKFQSLHQELFTNE